jgi:hypothetical protein
LQKAHQKKGLLLLAQQVMSVWLFNELMASPLFPRKSVPQEEFKKCFVGPPIDLANELATDVTSHDNHGVGGILPFDFFYIKW